MLDMQVIKDFLNEIGIPYMEETITVDTFLPGILIRNGAIIVDTEKLLYPGDILHEAGHIAAMEPGVRNASGGNVGVLVDKNTAMGEEMIAIAWSYAASVKLGLPPELIFHPDGYRGASDWYIEQFTSGNCPTLPLLQWAGFCYDEKNAAKHNVPPYPHMIRWLRE